MLLLLLLLLQQQRNFMTTVFPSICPKTPSERPRMPFSPRDLPFKRRRSDAASALHRPPQPAAPPCSLQLRAASEMSFRSRVFATNSHNSSGAPSVRPPPPLPAATRFTGTISAEALDAAHRLRLLGCGLLGMLVLRMADASVLETRLSPAISEKARRLMRFDGSLRRVGAGRGFNSPEGARFVQQSVQPLLHDWRFAEVAAIYCRSVALGLVIFRAELAWLLVWGRDGVCEDKQAACRIAQEGSRRGCAHSRGVFAVCLACGIGCPKDAARAMQLAGDSAASGSKYGHYAVARLLFEERKHDSRVACLFRKAAEQNLDAAQWCIGYLHEHGLGVPQNFKEAMHWCYP